MQAVPKVSPPAAVAAVSRPSQGQVLDKIQAELAETRRREDELRRQRQPRDSGGQHSLDTGDLDTGEGEGEEVGTDKAGNEGPHTVVHTHREAPTKASTWLKAANYFRF